MGDKRGKWSKEDRDWIWDNYNDKIIWNYFKSSDKVFKNLDFKQKSFCSECGYLMLKAQYQGVQPDKDYSWDIDHIDSNPNNNNIDNLQPMHPWCNKAKG